MPPAPRKRAAEVCQNCHRRKIKCDIHDTGSPCTKCSENKEACEARTRKPYAPRRSKKVTGQKLGESESVIGVLSNGNTSIVDGSDSDDRNDQVVANAITSGDGLSPNAETVPLFVGDEHGIGELLGASDPNAAKKSQKRHLMIPRTAAKALQAEDLEYLKAKGCFSLPTADVCAALIESYFRFVHPVFPIIDAHEFLARYSKFGVQQINLLLLWSMFSVSASYIEDDALKTAGYVTRKAFKENIVKRAKLLWDLSCENDKIVLIQSALLLGFWFIDAEDVKQSWYWTGIAISISQTIGLHRDPDSKRRNSALSDQQRRSWRNIWWGCAERDSWLAFGMGRPVRINLQDCDCPMPTVQDAEANFNDIVVNGKDLYAPHVSAFAGLWRDLLAVSAALNTLLSVRYRSHLSPPPQSRVDTLRNELDTKFKAGETITTENSSLTVAARQVLLHQRAAQIALFRPDSDRYAIEKVQEAAGAINTILEKSMADGTAIHTGPATMSLIVPAMITHLTAVKSKNALASQLGAHKLELCMMFMKTLENNYPAAGIIRKLFMAVNKKDKSQDEAAVIPHGVRQHRSPDALDLFAADSRSPDSDIGASGFALLPMQGGMFDMNDTDHDLLNMNFELDATQSFMGSELLNDFSSFMDPYPPIP